MSRASATGASLPAKISLDHTGAIVRDFAATALCWQRLGFLLSPVSPQRGRLPGRDEEGIWGTANRCAIFDCGYLELIGAVDPQGFNPWARFLERFDGLHLLALRVSSADETWAQLSSAPALATWLDAPVQRARVLDVDGVERTMRFRNVFSRDAACPEGRYILIEHQTPEYLWQPRYRSHPNGARSLEAAFLCCEESTWSDGHPYARIAAMTGALPQPRGPGRVTLDLPGGGFVEGYSRAAFEARWGVTAPAQPSFAGVRIVFSDRALAARLMEDNGVLVQRSGDVWHVGPDFTGGFVLELSELQKGGDEAGT